MNLNAPLLLRLALPTLMAGTASAQNLCDQISIDRIGYAPFSNGLEVVVHNGTDEFIGYPTVQLIDAMGDTLGSSLLQFFGITPHSDQIHQIADLEQTPSTPFSGNVVLSYSTMDGLGLCAFPITSAMLCPVEACIPLQVYTYFLSNAPTAELTWTITDQDGAEAAQGTLAIDPSGVGSVISEFCLPAGHYTLQAQQNSGDAWSFPIGLVTPDWTIEDAVHGTVSAGEELAFDFSFFEPCMAIGQGLRTNEPSQLWIQVVDQRLHVRSNDQRAIGSLWVMDAMGRIVLDAGTNKTAEMALDLGDLATGTYLVCSPTRAWPTQRIFVP